MSRRRRSGCVVVGAQPAHPDDVIVAAVAELLLPQQPFTGEARFLVGANGAAVLRVDAEPDAVHVQLVESVPLHQACALGADSLIPRLFVPDEDAELRTAR